MSKPVSGRPRVPHRSQASYAVGQALFAAGPKTESEVFTIGAFGTKRHNRAEALSRTFATGWLQRLPDGRIDLTEFGRAHFRKVESRAAAAPAAGVATAPAINLMARPPLRKEYRPNPRGLRADIPEWSVREGTGFHTKA